MVYVMIGIALLAGLMYAISRDGGGGSSARQLDRSRIDLLVGELIQHAVSAGVAVQQMNAFGTDYDALRFDRPGDADFNVGAASQVYNPAGGGIHPYAEENTDLFDPNSGQTRGWQWQNATNIEWTPTGGSDLLYSFADLAPEICEGINMRLHGSKNIPATTATIDAVFIDNATNEDFLIADCADCEGVRAMCIGDGDSYVFYNILGSR